MDCRRDGYPNGRKCRQKSRQTRHQRDQRDSPEKDMDNVPDENVDGIKKPCDQGAHYRDNGARRSSCWNADCRPEQHAGESSHGHVAAWLIRGLYSGQKLLQALFCRLSLIFGPEFVRDRHCAATATTSSPSCVHKSVFQFPKAYR